MPRPNRLGDYVVISFAVPLQVKKKLMVIARKKMIPLSEVARLALMKGLEVLGEEIEIKHSATPPSTPKSVDPLKPLLELDLEDLRRDIDNLTREVEEMVVEATGWATGRLNPNSRFYGQPSYNAVTRLNYLAKRWYSLRRLCISLANKGYNVRNEAAKLAELKRKMEKARDTFLKHTKRGSGR